MSIVAIVGAGMMGSAMSIPLSDNGHEVRLVGTPLDREIITSVQLTGMHPTLRRELPKCVKAFQVEDLNTVLEGIDLLIGGVSSFGVEWFAENVLPRVSHQNLPVLSVTKGLEEHSDTGLRPFPDRFKDRFSTSKVSFNAIGGPCTSYELADRRHSAVAFCGDDLAVLQKLKTMVETPYYHLSVSTDVIGIEFSVALKNAYALGVTLAIGLVEKDEGIGCVEAYNPQAALFGQSIREMTRLVKMFDGQEESVLFGASDLYVTVFGGRTRKLGTLLGRGLSFAQAMAELESVTLESVAIATRVANTLRKMEIAGIANMSDFPLLMHIDEIINCGKPVAIPWHSFG